MSETKLCPFRRVFDQILYEQLKQQKMDSAAGLSELFWDCLQEKCAMWHPEHTETQIHELGVHEYRVPGYCGLAGKP